MRLQIANFPRRLDFEAELIIGGGLGFRSTSFGGARIDELVGKYGIRGLKRLLDRNEIGLSNVWAGPLYQHEGGLWERKIQEVIPRLEAIAELGGRQIAINTPNRWPKAVTTFEWNWLVEKYRSYADQLRSYGLNLVCEYVGPQVERPQDPSAVPYPWIDNLKTAVEFVERIGRPNVGLIVDVIHWWVPGGTIEDLHRVKGLPLSLHFFDLPNGVTRETIEDDQRVLPGEGFLDLVTWLRTLRDDGFDGDVMPEVLGPRGRELAELDSWEGPRLVRDAYFKVLDQL